MPNSQKFIAFVSTVVGVVLCLLGLSSIGFYIYSVIGALDQADQSVIFWYLIFVLIGITLAGSGIYFIWLGYKTSKEERYTRSAKYSLGGLAAIITVINLSGAFNEWSADKARPERIELEDVQDSLSAGMHHIQRIELDGSDRSGFQFTIYISEGAEGRYRLKTSIYDDKALFLEKADQIELDRSETQISHFVGYEQLFQKCFDEFRGKNIYVCIDNTGATSFLTLESRLILIEDKQKTNTNLLDNGNLTSASKTDFSIDTFTKDDQVKVTHFQPMDR